MIDLNTARPLATALDRLLEQLDDNESPSFRALVEAAKLDPAHDFIGSSLREVDFRDEDLRGFDFSNADLTGADFRRANLDGVRIDGASLIGTIGLPDKSAFWDGLVKETTTRSFVKDVIEESKRQPVLIDFWAPWCGPCRQLTPVLEKAVRAANGRVKLVKMNIDDHPAIPGQMGIQSIPAVIAFVNGQPADGFMGAVPEGQVTAFIDNLTRSVPGAGEPNISEFLKEAETLLAEGDATTAATVYAEVLGIDPNNIAALAGLAKCSATTPTEQAPANPPGHEPTSPAFNIVQEQIDVPHRTQSSRIFVSHVSQDRKVVMDIVHELEQRDIRCWVAPRDVRPGQPFDDEIADAIEKCWVMLLIFSDLCNDSRYIRREVTVAGEAGKVIIPYRIENVLPRKGLRIRLADLHWIDAFAERDEALDILIRSLGAEKAIAANDSQ